MIEFLRDSIGSTVRPADASRLLGISQPALRRWLDNGEVASVMSPEGRRVIPLAELLDLLGDVAEARAHGSERPLSRVIRERNRAAQDAIDINRLLPPKRPRGHRVAELQSLAYHRLIGERLDPDLVGDAQRRLERWIESGRLHPTWAKQWRSVLARPLDEIAKTIAADTPRARELRQTSPFAGALTQQERRHLVEAVERRAAS